MPPRLKTEFWIDALLKRAHASGANGFVIHKGDVDAGAVLIKICAYGQLPKLLMQSRDMDGNIIFVDISNNVLKGETLHNYAENLMDNYANRRISQDCDLWFIEIEDKLLRNFLHERVE